MKYNKSLKAINLVQGMQKRITQQDTMLSVKCHKKAMKKKKTRRKLIPNTRT